MAKSLRDILDDCSVFEHDGMDRAHEQVLEFACLMHDRIMEKQTELAGRYDGEEAVGSWNSSNENEIHGFLHSIGKNVTEAGECIAKATISVNALIDVANIAMIVDGWLRDTYSAR